ncbi:MAG: GAF domain-containing sensor histidine kinase [Deinococcales bacterium]
MKAPTRLQRLATFNAIGDVLNAAPTFAEAAPEALRRLLERVALSTAWLFVSNVEQGDTHEGSFRLAASTGLPPALAERGALPLREPGGCECQRLHQRGQLDRGINMVTCSRLRDASGDKGGLEIHASVPLPGRAGPVGILNLAAPGDTRFDKETLAFLSAVGRQLAVAYERSRLLEERTEHARYAAALEERQRLAQQMHDSLAQLLFAADLSLQVAGQHPDPDQRARAAVEAGTSVRDALAELRSLVEVMRPADLSTGLRPALQRLARRTGASLRVHLEAAEAEPPAEVAEALFRIAQEAVHNTLRHAKAGSLWLRLTREPTSLALVVEDDGVGFGDDPEARVGRGLGLAGMRERAAGAAGTLRLEQRPGGGARVVVEVPWPRAS